MWWFVVCHCNLASRVIFTYLIFTGSAASLFLFHFCSLIQVPSRVIVIELIFDILMRSSTLHKYNCVKVSSNALHIRYGLTFAIMFNLGSNWAYSGIKMTTSTRLFPHIYRTTTSYEARGVILGSAQRWFRRFCGWRVICLFIASLPFGDLIIRSGTSLWRIIEM